MAENTQQIEDENVKGCGDKHGFGCLLDILFVLVIFAIPIFSIIMLFKSDTRNKIIGGLGLVFSALIFYVIYGNRKNKAFGGMLVTTMTCDEVYDRCISNAGSGEGISAECAKVKAACSGQIPVGLTSRCYLAAKGSTTWDSDLYKAQWKSCFDGLR